MTRRRKNKRKIVFGSLFLVVLVIVGVAVVVSLSSQNETEGDDTTEVERTEEPQEEKAEKTEETEKPAAEDLEPEKEKEKENVTKYEGDNPNIADDLSGVVTYAGVNGANLVIRVNIDQYLSNGTCELILARSGATLYRSIANIVGGATTSSCEGFDVSASGFGGGAVEITINLNADGRKGVIRGEANI